MGAEANATIAGLCHVPENGKAEIINGEVVLIADYFAAGAEVVRDVDILGEDVIKVYRASDPQNPAIYRRGDIAEAEPAVPGWRVPVDSLFE